MTTQPNLEPASTPQTQPDPDAVRLDCAQPGCWRWAIARARHVDNLTASGAWRCHEHKEPTP